MCGNTFNTKMDVQGEVQRNTPVVEKYHCDISYSPVDGMFTATCKELPFFIAYGKTQQEVMSKVVSTIQKIVDYTGKNSEDK